MDGEELEEPVDAEIDKNEGYVSDTSEGGDEIGGEEDGEADGDEDGYVTDTASQEDLGDQEEEVYYDDLYGF